MSQDIKNYLDNAINNITSSMNDNDLFNISENISKKLCEDKSYYGNNDTLKNKIYYLLQNYQSGLIDKNSLFVDIDTEFNTFISNVKSTSTTSISTPSSGTTTKKSGNQNYSQGKKTTTTVTTSTKKTDEKKTTTNNNNSTKKADEKKTTNEKKGNVEKTTDNNETSSASITTASVGTSSVVGAFTGVTTSSTGTPASTNFSTLQAGYLDDSEEGNVVAGTTSTSSSGLVSDVTVEEISSAASIYAEAEAIANDSSFTTSVPEAQEECAELQALAIETQEEVQGELGIVNAAANEVVNEVISSEEEIVQPAINEDGFEIGCLTPTDNGDEELPLRSFTDIAKITSNWVSRNTVKKMDATVFRQCGYNVSSSGIVSIDGYSYDTNTGKLENRSTGRYIYVDYYIPKNLIGNNEKLSKANTITCLAGSSEDIISSGAFYGNIENRHSDAILVMPSKKEIIEDNDLSYSTRLQEVTDSTIFATKFSRQKKGCNNIIMGCSSGGGSALKAAAASDVYDTVVPINYPALVSGVKSSKGQKEDRITEADIMRLKNKTILFVESGGDVNRALTEESMQKLSRDNSNIYYLTNASSINQGSGVHVFDRRVWYTVATQSIKGEGRYTYYGINNNGEYDGHPACRGIMMDIINSGMFNRNAYNSNGVRAGN